MEPKFYRIKNPETGLYYLKQGCMVHDVSKDEARIYSSERAKEIIHDADVMADVLADYLEQDHPFSGYQLEEVKISEVPLNHIQMDQVRAYARNRNVSVMEAATKYRLQIVNRWDDETICSGMERIHHEVD